MSRSQQIFGRDEARLRADLRGIVTTGEVKAAAGAYLTGEMLATHGSAIVVDHHVNLYAKPELRGSPTGRCDFGTTLKVQDLVVGRDGASWLKVEASSGDRQGFMSLPQPRRPATIVIGRPAAEIFLEADSAEIPWLVRKEALLSALAELRASGREVGWLSITTPGVDDERAQELLGARASHAAYLAEEAGIPRGKISVVEGLESAAAAPQVRIRIFTK
jgi:hypothetical protein